MLNGDGPIMLVGCVFICLVLILLPNTCLLLFELNERFDLMFCLGRTSANENECQNRLVGPSVKILFTSVSNRSSIYLLSNTIESIDFLNVVVSGVVVDNEASVRLVFTLMLLPFRSFNLTKLNLLLLNFIYISNLFF